MVKIAIIYLNNTLRLYMTLSIYYFIFIISAVSSKVQYSLFEWIYTALFYMFSCLIFYDMLYDKDLLKHHIAEPTMDSINYILVTLISVCIVLLSPLLASRVHKTREEYRKHWLELQVSKCI